MLVRPELRIRAIRRHAWLVAPVITLPASYMCMLARAPGAPWWVVVIIALAAVPVAGVLMGRVLSASVQDLLVARLGSADERRRRLAEAPSRFTPITSRAALAIEAGELADVARSLDSLTAIDRKQPLYRLVRERRALVIGEPDTKQVAIAALLEWRPLARFGVHGEIARYHAFILASALAERASDDASVVAAAKRLREDRDLEVRAYATWLDGETSDADLLVAGAALARAGGRAALAQRLELRATRATAKDRAPYRAGSSERP